MSRRILTAIVSVAALAVVLFALPLAVAVAHLYRDDDVVRLEREATRAAGQVSAVDLGQGDPVELPAAEAGTNLSLYDRDGNRLLGPGPDRLESVVAGVLRGRPTDGTAGGNLIVAVPVAADERVVAAVRAAEDEARVRDRVHRTWLAMIGIGGIVVVAAAGVALVVARRLTRPVVDLASTAARLGDGDFAIRPRRTGISELDTAGAALAATAARLGGLVSRERAYGADLSHQLRTPLTGLRLQIESALAESARADGGADPDAVLRGALVQIDRLEATIDDVIALGRDIDTGRRLIDLGPVLDEAELRWHGLLASAGRPLRIQRPAAVPPVAVSAAAVRQILDVLVANAVEHGSGAVTVTVRSTPGGTVLDVADEGVGVDGRAEDVFARRTEPESGRGIGLALARRLAEADGGRLLLRQSGPNPTFSLVLPVDDE